MKIISFSNFARYESAFALLTDEGPGEQLRYITIDEERLLRIKHTYDFPLLAMEYCLKEFGIESLDEIDLLVTDYARRPSMYNDGPGYRKLEHDYLKARINIPREKTVIINHHFAHAVGAYYPSGFDDTAIVIVDGMGSDLETQSLFHAKDGQIEFIENGQGWGLGSLYSAVTTDLLGFTGLNGVDLAGKTMGLAPLGRHEQSDILDIRGVYSGMTTDYSHFISRLPKPHIRQQGLKPCKDPKEVTNEYYSRIAFEVQREIEQAMLHLADYAYEKTGSKNLCISGGVGLNSVANGKIKQQSKFDQLYVVPCCSDTGIAIAMAKAGYYHHWLPKQQGKVKPKQFSMPTAYTGRDPAKSEIQALLDRCELTYEPTNLEVVTDKLIDGQIIGWFQHGSEIGPRALGHRSIIVDPRRPDMKDTLNRRVKHREAFRPFAPFIMEEHVSEYFPIEHRCPFMLEVYPIKEEMRDKIPAVTHVDGTGRLQTVCRDDSPEYYDLLKTFHARTGVPVLLNTSFNDKEPIVESCEDALITWLGTEIDMLVLQDFMLFKDRVSAEQQASVRQSLMRAREQRITSDRQRIKETYFQYNADELQGFLAEEEKQAEWRLKYRAKYLLENFLDEQKQRQDRLVLMGTRRHTNVLCRKLYDFHAASWLGLVCCDTKFADDATSLVSEIDLDTLSDPSRFEKVVVSTHEYQTEVLEQLKQLGVPDDKVLVLYDNAADCLTRSLAYLPDYN